VLLTVALIYSVTAVPMSHRIRQRNELWAKDAALVKLCEPAIPTQSLDLVPADMTVKVKEDGITEKPKLTQKQMWEKTGGQKLREGINRMLTWALANVQSSFKQIIKEFVASELKNAFGNDATKVVSDISKPKLSESAWNKIHRDYHDNYLRLIDAVRASVIYKSLDDMKAGVCRFRTFLSKFSTELTNQCSIVQFKDNTGNAGYKDINLSFKCVFGRTSQDVHPYIMELQFHVCNFIMAKQGSAGTVRALLKIPEDARSWDQAKLAAGTGPVGPWKLDMNGHEMYEAWRKITTATDANKLTLTDKMNWLYSTQAMGSPAAIAGCAVKDAPKFDKYDDDYYWEDDN